MWRHFWNLCSIAWENLISRLSTSTLSVIIFSIAIPVIVFVALFIYNLIQVRKAGAPIGETVKTSITPSLISAGLTVFVWISLFTWSIITTIYKDHEGLVSEIPKVKQKQAAEDQSVIDSQKAEINLLKKQIPKLNPQCWMQSVPLRAPKIPETAQSESEAVIVCNTDLKAPRTMTLYYDQNPTGYSFPVVQPEKTAHWGFTTFNDKSLTTSLTQGTIAAYQAFIVAVDGGNTTLLLRLGSR